MNNTRLRFYFKIFVFTLLFFAVCAFQTSFWPNIIRFLPSPQIWLILIIFITFKWAPFFTIFYIYFLGYCMTMFSNIPLKMVWVCLLITFTLVWFIKSRIQLRGLVFFILLTLAGSACFELSYFYFSEILETTPTYLNFIDRMVQILMNFIFCYPTYIVLDRLDNLLFDENEWARSTKSNYETQHE